MRARVRAALWKAHVGCFVDRRWVEEASLGCRAQEETFIENSLTECCESVGWWFGTVMGHLELRVLG